MFCFYSLLSSFCILHHFSPVGPPVLVHSPVLSFPPPLPPPVLEHPRTPSTIVHPQSTFIHRPPQPRNYHAGSLEWTIDIQLLGLIGRLKSSDHASCNSQHSAWLPIGVLAVPMSGRAIWLSTHRQQEMSADERR